MATTASDIRFSYGSSNGRRISQSRRTSSVALSRHRRHTVAVILLLRKNCERCRNGDFAPFETLPEDVLNIVARYASAKDIFSLVQVSHTLALTLISRNAPRDSQLQSALHTARVHLNQPLGTWMHYIINSTGLGEHPAWRVVSDVQVFEARLRKITNIKSSRPSNLKEWLYELVDHPLERDHSVRFRHEKQIRLVTLSKVHTELFEGVFNIRDYHENLIAGQLMDVFKSHPCGLQMATIIIQHPRFNGRVTPLALLAAAEGDTELIARIAHEIDRDAAEGLLQNAERRDCVGWILSRAAGHAAMAGHLDIAVTLSELHEEVFERHVLALSTTATALFQFRFISAWKLACRSPALDRVHVLAACLVPLSYCARIRAEYMYVLAYHLIKDYRSPTVTTIIRSIFVTHAAMAVPVALGHVVGQRTLFVGAVLAYICVWAERLLGEYILPSLPKSIRDVIGRQQNMDAPLQLCFLVLWAMWLGAHVNNSYFEWLWGDYYWSPMKIIGAFVRSFNASFSSSLMLYMIYDYDVFTRNFTEVAGGTVAGQMPVSWRTLALMWTCTVLAFVLYEHMWPFTWAWQLVVELCVTAWDGIVIVLNVLQAIIDEHNIDLGSFGPSSSGEL